MHFGSQNKRVLKTEIKKMASRMARKAAKDALKGGVDMDVLKQQIVEPKTEQGAIVLVTMLHYMMLAEKAMIENDESNKNG